MSSKQRKIPHTESGCTTCIDVKSAIYLKYSNKDTQKFEKHMVETKFVDRRVFSCFGCITSYAMKWAYETSR